jgi:hypothetical protein
MDTKTRGGDSQYPPACRLCHGICKSARSATPCEQRASGARRDKATANPAHAQLQVNSRSIPTGALRIGRDACDADFVHAPIRGLLAMGAQTNLIKRVRGFDKSKAIYPSLFDNQ